jgi:predicted PurR-regulated permease PerM
MPETLQSESVEKEIESWTTSQVVLATLFVVCVFLFFWLLYQFRAVVFLFFIAIVIGTTMRPAVELFYRRGVSRPAGIIIIYIVIAALLAGFIILFVPLLVEQATLFSQHLPQIQTDFRSALINSSNLLLRNIGLRIPANFDFFGSNNPTPEEVLGQMNKTFHYVSLVMRGILGVLAVFLIAYYWTQESNFMIRSLLRLVPRARRSNVREFVQKVEEKLGGYLRGEALLCFAVGSAAFVAYALIGLPYTLLLGIFAGFMELIPIFGPALGAVPAFLVAMAIQPEKAIWVIIATIAIQALENVLLVPRIMKNSMGVHPIIILLSLITFNAIFGFLGALLALPLAAIIQLILEGVILSAATPSKRVQSEDDRTIEELINESEVAYQIIIGDENSVFHNMSKQARKEITGIAQELDNLLKAIKTTEEEA